MSKHDLTRAEVLRARKRVIAQLQHKPYSLLCNHHHMVPKSRYEDFGLRGNFPGNILYLPKVQHDAYHHLFRDLVAEEVIQLFKTERWWPRTSEERTELRLACPFADTRQEVINYLANFWSVREKNAFVWQTYIRIRVH